MRRETVFLAKQLADEDFLKPAERPSKYLLLK